MCWCRRLGPSCPMRIVPGSDPVKELDALVHHLETQALWGAQVEVQRTKAAPPFRCRTDGPAYAAARQALEAAYGKPAGEAGSGASIPLLRTLQEAAPEAEFILWGPEDVAAARIHSPDERASIHPRSKSSSSPKPTSSRTSPSR